MFAFKSLRAAALLGAALFGFSMPNAAGAHTRVVAFHSSYGAGTIIISMSQRKLFYVLDRRPRD